MTVTEYRVQGMTCGHCENAVRTEVAKLEGVTTLAVSAADGILRIESTAELSDEAVRAAVEEAGYEVAQA